MFTRVRLLSKGKSFKNKLKLFNSVLRVTKDTPSCKKESNYTENASSVVFKKHYTTGELPENLDPLRTSYKTLGLKGNFNKK